MKRYFEGSVTYRFKKFYVYTVDLSRLFAGSHIRGFALILKCQNSAFAFENC